MTPVRMLQSLCFLGLMLVVGTAWAQTPQQLPLSGSAKVTFMEGRVGVIKDLESNKASPLSEGDEVAAPVIISVGDDGRLELLLPDGSLLRFSSGTVFQLVHAVANTQNRRVEVDVGRGDCWATVRKFLGEEDSFDVYAPTAVAGVTGTRYRLHVDGERNASFKVYDGAIKVKNRWGRPENGLQSQPVAPGDELLLKAPAQVKGPVRVDMDTWVRIVKGGQQFYVSAGGRYGTPTTLPEDDTADPWVQWNLERDDVVKYESW